MLQRHMVSLRWLMRGLLALGLVSLLGMEARSDQGSVDRAKQIAELERQLTDLQKKLEELKKESTPPAKPRPLQISDIATWRRVSTLSLSNNGEWAAFRVGPSEGDGEVVLRNLKTDKETKYPAGGGIGTLSFSFDSKWFAFTINPPTKAGPSLPAAMTGGAPPRRPVTKVALINLATMDKVEYEGIRRFSFSGESATHIVFQKNPPESSGAGSQSPASSSLPPGIPPGLLAALGSGGGSFSLSSDIILRELSTGTELVIGNVSDYSFNKKGEILAYTIDARDQIGSGVQIRNMKTGVIAALETGKASYSNVAWTEQGDALTALKGIEDPAYEGKVNSILGFTKIDSTPEKTVYEPAKDSTFPKGMTVSTYRTPIWNEDRSAFVFGITELKRKDGKKDDPKKVEAKKEEPKKEEVKKEEPKKEEPKKEEGKKEETKKEEPKKEGASSLLSKLLGEQPKEKPDLVVWHWKDERLQSQQQVQAPIEKMASFLATYRIKEKKFIRLADETLKNVNPAPKHKFAIGVDNEKYQLMGSLDGKRFQDVYVVNMETGERKVALTKKTYYFGPSPTGTHFLYYEDGHFFTYEMASGKSINITTGVPTSFVDTEDDHNIQKPPTRPAGWTEDGKHVLLDDGWDLWAIPAQGGNYINLTIDGKKEQIRYGGPFRLDPEEKGIHLEKPLFVSLYGEWTKKSGFGRIDPNKPGVTKLCWEDASFGTFVKARQADTYMFSKDTWKESEFHCCDASFNTPKKITNTNPQQEKIAWSSGSQLLEYKSAKGDRLQAAVHLPANYEKGKKYPCIVYIYEKLSDGLNRYVPPVASGSGFNKSIYTSNGYVVLMPDIVYSLNDPGKSAVACVLPALKAAIEAGIVDPARVGLQGHSWGGYQTAFLITQTEMFKAACAGAPLTNLISMYSSIYWNTGSANQPIFESSQGRFTGGYWENQEAYIRNSPVFNATNVRTPLLLLHNDKDGAVDFNQGIEYFNTLRRLQKPVIMLQYKGENHGLAKLANRKDYTIRMKEFFDHHLMDKPAPEWMTKGVPHLKMDDHLKDRLKDFDNE